MPIGRHLIDREDSIIHLGIVIVGPCLRLDRFVGMPTSRLSREGPGLSAPGGPKQMGPIGSDGRTASEVRGRNCTAAIGQIYG